MKASRLIIVVLAIGLMLGLAGIASAATITCGQCHGAYINSSGGYTEMPGVAAYEDVKTPQDTDICTGSGRGLHGVHMNYSSATYGRWNRYKNTTTSSRGACEYCHNKHYHENGYVEFSGVSVTTPTQKAISVGLRVSGTGIGANGLDINQMTGTATCTAACHKGTSGSNPATWGNYTSSSIKLACDSCHGDSTSVNMTNFSTANLSFGHGLHIAKLTGTGNAVCHNCHPDNAADLWSQGKADNGSVKAYPHATDGTNVQASNVVSLGRIGGGGALNTFNFNYSTQTCTSVQCHYGPVTWSDASAANNAGCGSCHEYPGVAGKDWTTTGNGHLVRFDSPAVDTHLRGVSNYSKDTDTYAGVVGDANKCGNCHGAGTHWNGTVEVSDTHNLGNCASTFTFNNITTGKRVTCGNVKCHSGRDTPNWW